VEEALPEAFIQKDLQVGIAQDVICSIMYTTLMLTIMSKCKVSYVGATFKAVQRPFAQLFSVQ
jgi:hypothetical protein